MDKQTTKASYHAICDFRKGAINGWRKDVIVVSKSSCALDLDFEFKSTVIHNWPSQFRSHFPEGYIQFANGKRFDRKNCSIRGEPRWMFRYSDVRFLWELFELKCAFRTLVSQLSEADLVAVAQLMSEIVQPQRPAPRYRVFAERELALMLDVVGVHQLRQFLALVKSEVLARDEAVA